MGADAPAIAPPRPVQGLAGAPGKLIGVINFSLFVNTQLFKPKICPEFVTQTIKYLIQNDKIHEVTPNRALLLCILVFVLVAPATAGSVERTVAQLPEGAVGDLEVTLTVTDIPVGGIVETIPDGCTWAGCDHPDDRTRVSNRTVAFAVIGEETIRYRLQGPPEAGVALAGTWEGLLTGESGVVGSDEPRDSGQATQTTVPGTPGFGYAAALAALAVVFGRRCGR